MADDHRTRRFAVLIDKTIKGEKLKFHRKR